MIIESYNESGGIDSFQPVEPQLLYATFAIDGDPLYRNPAWESVLGTTSDPWLRLSEEDRVLVRRNAMEAGEGFLVTNEIILVSTPDRDEPVPVLLNFFPVHGTTPEGIITAITITGEVLAEPTSWTTSQTQRHRLESLGRMTMGIVHDIKNMLSPVVGHAEVIKVLLSNHPAPDVQLEEHIRLIEQAALDGATLVSRIQQYIRQDKHIRFEPLDVPSLIRDCVSLTRPYWYNEPRRQGICIEVGLDLDEVPPISGSATELREVFVNLILNAVQAMPEGGSIHFGAHYEKSRGVIVTVSDTGTGMSESVRRRIFEPLFTTKGEHGTGMGLAVSYGIIQTHEGNISVESSPGKGTKFEVIFPTVAHPLADTRQEVPLETARPVRILVVDDDAMVRSVLVKLLSLKGHTVEQAPSGKEALKLLESTKFDIIFTDHGMPEMNGRQLAAAIRRNQRDIPIILLTGETEAGKPDRDINYILDKPFKLDRLQATIEKFV